MDYLVEKLSNQESAVEFEVRTKTLKEIEERLNRRFVFVTFIETQGGTELGIDLDEGQTRFFDADFEKGTGKISISGTCELNFQKVRCIAEIDLSTRKGKGYLLPIDGAGNPLNSTIHKCPIRQDGGTIDD